MLPILTICIKVLDNNAFIYMYTVYVTDVAESIQSLLLILSKTAVTTF